MRGFIVEWRDIKSFLIVVDYVIDYNVNVNMGWKEEIWRFRRGKLVGFWIGVRRIFVELGVKNKVWGYWFGRFDCWVILFIVMGNWENVEMSGWMDEFRF